MTQKLQPNALGASASSRGMFNISQPAWSLLEEDLKKYPHFDAVLTPAQAIALATDSKRVASHAFYPFIMYEQKWKKFRGSKSKSKPKPKPLKPIKSREIRYAARADAYIYSYYRFVLKDFYEKLLVDYGLQNSVIAYRRVVDSASRAGKSNIHFANEAFIRIRGMGDCCVIALDIKSFFESIDHQHLKNSWIRTLGAERLPLDHYKVFKNITNYSVVDKTAFYRALGHYGIKYHIKKVGVEGYLTQYSKIPRRLCSGQGFRAKIAGGHGVKSLIQKNWKSYGIPQGSPISDLLANMYMLEFDRHMNTMANNLFGFYTRYSDDILFIIPGQGAISSAVISAAKFRLSQLGANIILKQEKTQIFEFKTSGDHQIFDLILGSGASGLEYLGFRYDGRSVYLRNSTISNINRKIKITTRGMVKRFAAVNPSYDYVTARKKFNSEILIKKFAKVEDWKNKKGDTRNWTFRTYALKAANVFGQIGTPISRQIRGHRSMIESEISRELRRRFPK